MTDTDLRPHIRRHLEVGDPSGGVMTWDGKEVVIYTADARGDYPIHGCIQHRDGNLVPVGWDACGNLLCGVNDERPGDLISRPAPKRRVKAWVNVYINENGDPWFSDGHEDKDEADRRCMPDRIACIEIDVEEGEGLS